MTNPLRPMALGVRLSVMMFLQYAIWGAWLPILYPFLLGHRGLSLTETGLCLSAGAIGAIFGPFIAGQLADRRFATERLLAVSHIVGAGIVFLLGSVEGFWMFFALSAIYGFVYAPTIALTNSLSFAHILDRDRDFGPIRLWGTIGWIVAGILVGQSLLRSSTPDLVAPTRDVTTAEIMAAPETALPLAMESELLAGANLTVDGVRLAIRDRAVEMVREAAPDDDPAIDARIEAVVPAGQAIVVSDLADSVDLEPAEVRAELEQAVGLYVQRRVQDRDRSTAFMLSAILGLIMGVYCLTLPHTPPVRNEKQKLAWAEALGEIRLQPLVTLFIIAVPVSMIHQFYFVFTSDFVTGIQNAAGSAQADRVAGAINGVLGVGGGGLMTIGQMSEIPVLALMPFLTKVLSRKALLAIGLAAYAGRMAIFAFAPDLLPVIFGVALHGLCFGCFIFVAFMVVDENTTPDIRATAQNLFNLVIVGIGIIVGSWFATGVVGAWASTDSGMDYTRLFSVPMWMALACLGALLIAYPRGHAVRAGDEA